LFGLCLYLYLMRQAAFCLYLTTYRYKSVRTIDIYNIHQNNTWHHEHFEAHWKHAQQHFSNDAYITILQQVASRVPLQDYLQALDFKNHPLI
jgi:hypothetical protein